MCHLKTHSSILKHKSCQKYEFFICHNKMSTTKRSAVLGSHELNPLGIYFLIHHEKKKNNCHLSSLYHFQSTLFFHAGLHCIFTFPFYDVLHLICLQITRFTYPRNHPHHTFRPSWIKISKYSLWV